MAHEDISPPLPTAYKGGRIFINDGQILLDNLKSKKSGHAVIFAGIYCEIECLCNHLRKLRKEI